MFVTGDELYCSTICCAVYLGYVSWRARVAFGLSRAEMRGLALLRF